MRWFRPAKQRPWEWHQWFAWYPVVIPDNIFSDRHVIWWEYVERRFESCWGSSWYHYREIQK